MAKKAHLSHKHDDIDLGLSVSVMLGTALGTLVILPFSPSIAYIFLISVLVLLAVLVARYDYHD